MRKFWLVGVLVLVLVIITVAYIRLVLVMSENRSPFDALPESVSIIIDFNNPKDALEKLSGSELNPYLSEAAFFKKMKTQLAAIDTFFYKSANDTTFKTWENTTVLASMSITGRDEFDYLYVLKKKLFSKELLEKFIKSAETSFKLSKREFRDASIYEVNPSETDKYLTCAFVNGLFIASFSPVMVDEAIAQLRDNKSILKNKDFKEVNELAGEDADAVVYFNFANLGRYKAMLVNEEQDALFKSLTQFGSWMELDLKMKDNSFIINGYANTGRKKTFLTDFKSEPTSQMEITHVLPHNTSLFFYHAVDDFRNYAFNRGEAFSGELENFRNWIGNEWCFGLLEPLDERYESDAFLVVKAMDPEIAAQSLAERARLSGDDLKGMEEFKTYPIGQLTLNSELNKLFGHDFLKINNPYYAVLDEYVVFANDLSVIKTVLDSYEEMQTLATDPDYMIFERNLTTTSNFYVYFNTSKSVELLNRVLSNSLRADIRKGNKDFVKFSPVALQFSQYQDIFFTNGYIQFSSQSEEHTNRMWQAKLDATPMGSPAFVVNHYTGDKEIIVQDSLNNIYLITKSGKILWKRKLDGPVMSDIYLIDFYENTKLQFAFNTRGKIYMIDRKGEDVATYPIRLPADATNGMLLVDYEKKKDYRMFVACSNGNIYGYYKSGKPLPGWSPQEKIGKVKFPLKYIMNGNKDYLICFNDAGEMFFFNRKGDRRMKPIKFEKSFASDFQVRPTKGGFQLLNVGLDGTVYKAYYNGASSSQKQPSIPQNFFQFFYTDLNSDGHYEMVFVDSLVTKVLDEGYAEIASPSFPEKIDKTFLFDEPGQHGIGFLSRSGQKIYMVGSDYQPNPAFPLASCTPFITADLFETGRRVVIAGDCDGWVNAYQVK